MNIYQQIATLIATLRAEHEKLAADGVLSWREAVQLIVHAFRELARLVNSVREAGTTVRATLLREAAGELFDQVVAPILAAKLSSKWYLKAIGRWVIPAVRAFWMRTAENALEAMANILAAEQAAELNGPPGPLVGLTAREVRYGKA